jgi:hypothetical protein
MYPPVQLLYANKQFFKIELVEWLKWQECLLSKREALSSNPSATKKQTNKQKNPNLLYCLKIGRKKKKLGIVVYTSNTSTQEDQAGGLRTCLKKISNFWSIRSY